jgi:hypothetical protein
MAPEEHKPIDGQTFRTLKHDIRNQLSNIIMAIEQLRYELPQVSDDCRFYIKTINDSCSRINGLLDSESGDT